MGTVVQWTKCWLLLTIISNIYSTGDVVEHGTTVLFDDLKPGNYSIEIQENNYINFTVHINNQNVFNIKLSHQRNNLSVDFCKFSLKTVCDVSDSSNATSHCRCLNNHTVQFLKKASSSDSGLYTWQWRDGWTPERQRNIFINVKRAPDIPHTGNHSDDAASGATTTTTVCVLLTVVVTATVGLVLWMRNKAKCSIEVKVCDRYYRWRGSDHAKDNEVHGLALSNVDNHNSGNNSNEIVIVIVIVIDSNYADDNEEDTIQPDDTNNDDIKEQNKSLPPESSYNKINKENRSDDSTYAYVKKKGKSQSTDPTTPNVNNKDVS